MFQSAGIPLKATRVGVVLLALGAAFAPDISIWFAVAVPARIAQALAVE